MGQKRPGPFEQSMSGHYTRILTWATGFLTRRYGIAKDEEAIRRIAFVYASALLLLLLVVVWSVSFFSYGRPSLGFYAVFSGLIPLAILARIRDVRRMTAWSHLMIGMLLAAAVVANFFTGGLDRANGTVFVMVPLIAVLLLGRAGLIWGAITLACAGVFQGLTVSHFEFPQFIPEEDRDLDAVLTFVSTFLIVLGVASAYEQVRRRSVERLQAARVQAEEASRTKGRFLANMSHEIRTPLNAVIGLTEVMLGEELPEGVRERIGLIKESAESLHAVLNDVLDFSRIEAGKIAIERIEFDLERLVEGLLKTQAVRADPLGLELIGRVAGQVPERLAGDPTRLRQVLGNLVSNAVKFTEKGEIVVAVELEGREGGEARLRFSVRDTGIGIPRERQAAIFEAFTQADGSTTRRFGGTGLGLTISARLVELLGGRLEVESEVGAGSTFSFVLPFGMAAPPPAGPFRPEADLAGKRVLVIEDNPASAAALVDALDQLGMAAVPARDGREAIRAVDAARDAGQGFDFALVDGHLPEVDGLDVVERVRRHPSWKGAIVLMVGAAGPRGDPARGRESGVAAVVSKPTGRSELQGVLRRVIGRAEEPAGASAPRPEPWRRLKVLVVEDNAVNAQVVESIVARRGHDVALVQSGEEAVAALGRESYDAVLMDVQMPGMDGFETTRAIRAAERQRGGRTRIVALTAHAQPGDRDRCLEAGMDGYATKPIQTRELLSALEGGPFPPAGEEAASKENRRGPAVLDAGALLARVDGDRELAGELLESFRTLATRLASEIHEAARGGGSGQIVRAAHTLKGSAANMGAVALAAAAGRLEAAAERQDLAEIETVERDLAREMERLVERLGRPLEAQ